MRKAILMLFLLLSISFLWSNVSYAQNRFQTLFEGTWSANQNMTGQDVLDILSSIGGYLISAGAIIAGISIIIAGIIWMTAGSNQTRVASAKAWFKNGVIGGLIIFAFGIIISTIMNLAADWQAFFA